MSLLIILPEKEAAKLSQHLHQALPEEEIYIWPETGASENVELVVSWKHPHGLFNSFPNLKLICSYGAGVDHIFSDPDLPPHVPVARFIADSLARQMAEYVAGVILANRLRLVDYREYQAAGSWSQHPPRPGNRVALLGLGELGSCTANLLSRMDFDVSGWSRNPKDIPGCRCHHGENGLKEAVREADYIVCLLPLTDQTRGMLNGEFFALLKDGAYLINAARGGHLEEEDLLNALYQGKLSGACLDVFNTEPLPQDSPLWRHPRILITPHVASVSRIEDLAESVVRNFRNIRNGMPHPNLVDNSRGY